MRKFFTLIAMLGIALGLSGPLASAHHGTAAYDRAHPLTLKGAVTDVQWTNPHAWIYFDVKDADGNVVNWGVECGAPNALIRRGVTKASIPVGITIVVKGNPARDGSHIMILNTVSLRGRESTHF